MRSDPGHIATNAALPTPGKPCLKVEIEWTSGNWTDESSHALSASTEMQIMDPSAGFVGMGTALLGKATIKLRNDDSRYSTEYSGSQAATNGLQGKGIRISAGYYYTTTPEYVVVFTGRIMDPSATEATEEITLTCHDVGSDPKRQHTSTPLQLNLTTDAWMDYLATALGMSSTLEYGLISIPYAWLDDDNAVDELRTVASSEAGLVFWDVDGDLRFWNAGHWVGAASVGTVTVADYAEVSPGRGYLNTYNIIACPYAPRMEHQEDKVYSLKRTIAIEPGRTYNATLNFSWPLRSFTRYDMAVSSSGGTDLSASVTLDHATPTAAQRWDIVFTNANSYQTAYVTQFDIYGRALDGRQAETYTKDASGSATDRRYDVPRNVYIQTETHAAYVADMLAERLATPRLTAIASKLNNNPLLEMGDVVTATSVVTGLSDDMIITGITRTLGDAHQMNLSLVKADLYPDASYFKAGISALGASSPVAFY